MTACGKAARSKANREVSWSRMEASVKAVSGYYKPFAEAKYLEYKSWVDNEVFDLVDLRQVKPRIYATGRWVLAINTDEQGNLP